MTEAYASSLRTDAGCVGRNYAYSFDDLNFMLQIDVQRLRDILANTVGLNPDEADHFIVLMQSSSGTLHHAERRDEGAPHASLESVLEDLGQTQLLDAFLDAGYANADPPYSLNIQIVKGPVRTPLQV